MREAVRDRCSWLLCAAAVLLAAGPAAALTGGEPPVEVEVKEPEQSALEPGQQQSPQSPDVAPVATMHERVDVVGSPEAAREIPGSAHYIGAQELEQHAHSDVHRVLQSVPGLSLQEEDGYGLRPNIGMRGTGVERSQKITLLEDGVLIAPAPYTAPAAYYFPSVGRMEAVEVRKGSSSIRQGPSTNGGAINLISTSVPSAWSGSLDLAAGDQSTQRLLGHAGGGRGRFGWLVETFQLRTDGFKRLDGGGDTGVDLRDYMLKLRFSGAERSNLSQLLELKLGRTEQDGNETYLGLSNADFAATPLRRYAGSQVDRILADHDQAQLRHFVRPSASLDITTTVYSNRFYRNWLKNEKTLGVGNAAVLESPALYPEHLALLRGELGRDGSVFRLRHNQRDYLSEGVQSTLAWSVSQGETHHSFELGIRYHVDEEDRFQHEDGYSILGGRMQLASGGAPGSQTNRVADATALSLFIEHSVRRGRWTLTPGLRYETIDYERRDYSRADPSRSLGPTSVRRNGVDVLIPGLGLSFVVDDRQRLFLGLHRGFTPPGAGASPQTRAEESLNVEVGYRWLSSRWSADAVLFNSDYDNLLGVETVSGGGPTTGELFNGGEVVARGAELSAQVELSDPGSRYTIPLRLSYTHSEAEFRSSFATSFADWRPVVSDGDQLPYIPEDQLSVSLGVSGRRWSLHTSSSWVARTRTRAGSGPIPETEGADERFLIDLAADLKLRSSLRLFAQLRNLTDELYIAARRPYGVRPGLPRTVLVGVDWSF